MERGVRSSSTGRFACGNEVGYWQLARQGDGIVRRFVKVVGNMVETGRGKVLHWRRSEVRW